ncbi:chemotaxis protein CheW [Cystobacter fuscus]
MQDQEVRTLLDERANRLRGRSDNTTDESVLMVAEFPLGEERYAIPLDSLRAALPLRLVTPVPLSQPHVIGVLRYQGRCSPRSASPRSWAAMVGGRTPPCCSWWSGVTESCAPWTARPFPAR